MTSKQSAELPGNDHDSEDESSQDISRATDLQDEIRRTGSRAGRGGSLGPHDFDKDGHSIPPTPAELAEEHQNEEDSFIAAGVAAEEQTLPHSPDVSDSVQHEDASIVADARSLRPDSPSASPSVRSAISPGPRAAFERRFVARTSSGRFPTLRSVSGPAFLTSHSRNPSSSGQATLNSDDLETEEKDEPWEFIKWTKLKKITSQAYSESAKRAFGRPTALVVSASIVLGTSKGLILVFDYQQILKHVIGQGTIATECGSITAMAMSADHTTIAGGHANGSIHTWDLSQPSSPFLSIPAQSTHNRAQDGHLDGRAVLHLGFLGTRRTALISADDSGMAFSHLASRGLGPVTRSVTTTRILGRYPEPKISTRKPSSVLGCASLPLGNVEYPTDDFGLTAILTPYLLVIVSTTPIAQTQFKLPRSRDVPAHSAMTGCLSWFPSVKTKHSAPGGKVSITQTKLVFCWANVLTVLEIHPAEAEEAGKRASLDFEVRTRWLCEEPILAVQWISRSVLALLTITQRLLIIEDNSMNQAGSSDLNTRHLYHRDLFSQQLLPLVDKAEQEDSSLHGVVPDAYHMSVKAYKGRMFVLGMNDAAMGIMSNWADRLTALMQIGRYIEAVDLATAYYSGYAEKLTVGLPEDDDARHHIVKDKLLSMLVASLRYILQLVDDDESHLDVRTAFQEFVGPAFAACLAMNEIDFLLNDIYDWYSDQSCQDIFFYAVEPCILDDRIRSLPPAVLKDLTTWFASFGFNERLEELLIELDKSNMDIDQITGICKMYRLYDAMIHIWNDALDDYVTPLIELMRLTAKSDISRNNAESALDQECARKVFPYMAYILTGRAYPSGLDMSVEAANRARSWVYGFVFAPRAIQWPLQSRNVIKFSTDLKSDKSYPYLRHLIAFDCSNLMSMLNEAFEDTFLNGDEEQIANGAQALDLRDFTIGAKFSRQHIVNILIDVFRDPKVRAEDKIYFNIFLARNLPKYNQGFLLLRESELQRVIRELCQYTSDELAHECQLSVEYLLSIYHPANIQELIPLFEHAKFHRMLKMTYKAERQYAQCLEAYLADMDDANAIFDGIHDLLSRLSLGSRQAREVTNVIVQHADAIVKINARRAAEELLRSNPALLHEFASALNAESYGKFEFLQTLLEPERGKRDIANLPAEFPAIHIEAYVQLMCKYKAQHVADYVTLLETGNLRLDIVLPIMEETGAIDAAVVLMARDGLARDAMTRLTEHLERLTSALSGLLTAVSQQVDSSSEAVDDITATIQRYSKIGVWLCQSQPIAADVALQKQRRHVPVTKFTESNLTTQEMLWLDLIDATVGLSRKIAAVIADDTAPASEPRRAADAIRAVAQNVFTALLSVSATNKHILSDEADVRSSEPSGSAQGSASFIPILAAFLARASKTARSLADLRRVLVDVFSAYIFEESLFSLASKFLDKDVFEHIQDSHTRRDRGWRPTSMSCEGCRKRVWSNGAGVGVWDAWSLSKQQSSVKAGEKRDQASNYLFEKGKDKIAPSQAKERPRDEHPDVLVSFACGHIFHQPCLERTMAVNGSAHVSSDHDDDQSRYACPLCA